MFTRLLCYAGLNVWLGECEHIGTLCEGLLDDKQVTEYLEMVRACAELDTEEVLVRSQTMGFLTGDESQSMRDAHCQVGPRTACALRACIHSPSLYIRYLSDPIYFTCLLPLPMEICGAT